MSKDKSSNLYYLQGRYMRAVDDARNWREAQHAMIAADMAEFAAAHADEASRRATRYLIEIWKLKHWMAGA